MAQAKLKFYQVPQGQMVRSSPTVEAEIRIGDLSLEIHRIERNGARFVKVCVFTDMMAIWRRLDTMRVFHKIERAEIRDSDDLARLLVAYGLRHVPYPGFFRDEPVGIAEKARVKAIHSDREATR